MSPRVSAAVVFVAVTPRVSAAVAPRVSAAVTPRVSAAVTIKLIQFHRSWYYIGQTDCGEDGLCGRGFSSALLPSTPVPVCAAEYQYSHTLVLHLFVYTVRLCSYEISGLS